MKKSHECEVATHIGPESCGVTRKGDVEALTWEHAGRVFSRVRTFLRDADAVGESGASLLAGCLCPLSVIHILCAAWALLPKARAGCGKPARPDPWRGL